MQRYNINMTCSICDYFARETITAFVVLSFLGRELVRDFRRECGIRSLRIFSKPSAINGFSMPLPTTVWVRLVMLFPSTWWVIENFSLGLNANSFLYPLAVGGVRCGVVCLLRVNWGATEVDMNFVEALQEINLFMKFSLIFIWSPHFDMNVETMERFCKDTSWTFFNEFGLISHQINSFDSPFDRLPPLDMNLEAASRTFFNEFGLISHQINSFDPPSDWFGPFVIGRASIDRTGAWRFSTIWL